MSMILEESAISAKTKELCSTIVEQASFVNLQSQVEAFLSEMKPDCNISQFMSKETN